MDKNRLDAFITVYRTESIKEASDLLYLAQPSVTSRIQALESEVGEKLFNRTKRSMRPTNAGKTLYPYAVSIVDLWHKGIHEVQMLENRFKGNINIAVFYSGVPIFSPMLLKFTEKYPQIKLDMTTAHSGEITSLITDFKVDIGLSLHKGNTETEHHMLLEDKLTLVVHPDHPLANHTDVTLNELREDVLIIPPDQTFNKNIKQLLAYPSLYTIHADNLTFIKKLVNNNRGIAILPNSLIREELQQKKYASIICPYLENLAITSGHHLVWRKSEITHPILDLFIQFMVDTINAGQDSLI